MVGCCMDNGDVAKGWFKKGENDFRSAEYLLTMDDPPTDTISYHAQQTVEKFLKGFLAHHGQEVPRIHDIGQLILLCSSIDEAFNSILDDADELTEYAVEIRYPGPPGEIPIEDAEQALETARMVRDFVRVRLKVKKE